MLPFALSGIPGGEENGRRGYAMTFVIAYIRVSGWVEWVGETEWVSWVSESRVSHSEKIEGVLKKWRFLTARQEINMFLRTTVLKIYGTQSNIVCALLYTHTSGVPSNIRVQADISSAHQNLAWTAHTHTQWCHHTVTEVGGADTP